MNHFCNRVLSLALAVVFLLGAAGVSFYAVFGGPVVFAEDAISVSYALGGEASKFWDGSGSATLTFKVTDPSLKKADYDAFVKDDHRFSFKTNGVFSYSTTNVTFSDTATATSDDKGCVYTVSLGAATYAYQKPPATNVTKTDLKLELKISDTVTRTKESTWDFSKEVDGDESSSSSTPKSNDSYLQSYRFYDKNDNLITELRNGVDIARMELTVVDGRFNAATYNEAISYYNSGDKSYAFSASINYSTFSRYETDKTQPAYQFLPGATDVSGGASYRLEFYKVRYTGKTTTLDLKISYPQSFGVERCQFSESLPEGELYVPSSSGRDYDDDDDDDSSSSRVQIAPPTPNIIVSSYDYGGGRVDAATDVSMRLTFTNTSKRLSVDNIVMKITMPEALTMKDSANTYYVETLQRGESATRTINFSVKPNAEAISHVIKINFSFETILLEARKQLTSDVEIAIPVNQLNRVTLNPVEVPEEIYIGDNGNSIEATFVNKGKATIYNVTATIEGENLAQPGQPQFIGNLESGKEDSADFTLDGLAAGPVTGEIILTYEDANMHVSELRTPFTTNAISFQEEPPPDMGPTEPVIPTDAKPWYQTLPAWYWTVGGLVLAVLLTFLIKLMRTTQSKKLEAEDEDF